MAMLFKQLHWPRRFILIAVLTSSAGIAAASLYLLGSAAPNHTPPSKLASALGSPSPLEISPDPVLLGNLDAGQEATAKLTLRNAGSQPVTVASVETSCPCLNAAKQRMIIGPRQVAELAVNFDPKEEPDFRGGLSINVIGRDPTGGVLFRTRAEIAVRDKRGEPAEGLPSGTHSDPEGGA